jgi:hypothetical protein
MSQRQKRCVVDDELGTGYAVAVRVALVGMGYADAVSVMVAVAFGSKAWAV